MKLVASLMVRNELGRYLKPVIGHLQEFCDTIVALDDGSEDGSHEWLKVQERVIVNQNDGSSFYAHEGRTRQRLLELTLYQQPTHVLTIDADEFISDGKALREVVSGDGEIWRLQLQEVWKARPNALSLRTDGGWGVGSATVWAVPARRMGRRLEILDRQLACGRDPSYIRLLGSRAKTVNAPSELLHFGWANEAERQQRYQRYVDHDSGKFHARAHLDSIMWPDSRVGLTTRSWPVSLLPYRDSILAYAYDQTKA